MLNQIALGSLRPPTPEECARCDPNIPDDFCSECPWVMRYALDQPSVTPSLWPSDSARDMESSFWKWTTVMFVVAGIVGVGGCVLLYKVLR